MKTHILQQKLERYLTGRAHTSESKQIQTWLSCTTNADKMTAEERSLLEMEILAEIQAYTAYPLFYPKKDQAWWQKAVAAFF